MGRLSMLSDGLKIISACRKETGDIWQAHFGAAAIGSYFFAQANEMSPETERLMFMQAEEMTRKFGETKKLLKSDEHDAQIAEDIILAALEKTIDSLHWVGHNVIYSAASLSAIRELGGWGAEEEIEGIAELIRSFEKTIPGRSWIGYSASEVKRMPLTEEDDFPPVEKPKDLSALVLEELAAFENIYRAEAHHDLIGHMLTFSHALNILHDLGHVSFFRRGLPPLLRLVKALRASRSIRPDEPVKLVSAVDRLPLRPAQRSDFLPTDAAFWERDYSEANWDFGHIFKFPHSFYDHLSRVEPKREAYLEKFRYIAAQ
ncbi:hypothetical protein QWJ34_22120 [Saccharibacillus sp. CPCC 101409]|uniref:hypothetical protein n=1 Tax=Saccharibacillus sp. CPCC 101409 TaxID=3058041 RepID=UPI00267185FE|nr:hypothetical protein [Saccharibacillus sp. CPCC 101409]MDO3412477.1 hypothetical protein [Saccharibacillus sp. CPCC 101409]